MSGHRVLVLGPGDARGALAAVRALGEAGWAVGVGSPHATGLAASSRFTSWRHRIPAPECGLEEYVDGLCRAITERNYEVALAATDADALALSRHRERVATTIPYASHGHVVRALDKLKLGDAAAKVGIATPETAEASDEAIARWSYPSFVKARLHSTFTPTGGRARFEAMIATGPAEASQRAIEIRSAGGVPLLQRRVAGRLVAYTVASDRSAAIVARVAQVAERTWPPRTGISARARTVDGSEKTWRQVADLIAELGWFGLAELQFLEREVGDPVLIDLNGRFYGSLALAVAAGVNLPAIWASLAIDEPLAGFTRARTGVRYQWLEGDLRRALRERDPNLLQDLTRSLRFARGAAHSVWSRDDFRPALHYAGAAAGRALRRRLLR